MSTKFRKSTEDIRITATLRDGETNLFIRCKIFNDALVDVTNTLVGSAYLSLANVFGGLYGVVSTGNSFANEGQYTVYFETYEDAGFTTLSEKYGIVEETYWVSDFEQTILTEIPDNILLDDDPRLDNLNDIPDLATTTQLNNAETAIKDSINDNIDSTEGRVS